MKLPFLKIDRNSCLSHQVGYDLFSNNKNNQLMAMHIPGEGQISWTEFSWMVPQTLLLPGGQKISLRYDDFQQVKERVLKKADDTELAKAIYEYDLEQNIKKIERGEGIFNYGYGDLYRLTSADAPEGYAANDETFGYDGVGNRISRTENSTSESQSYNQKNQLQAIDSSDDTQYVTYTYNANGHTHSKTQHGIVTRYEYNHEERLIAVKRDGLTLGSYAYNPNGQRIKKTVNGNTTWYLYNENGLAAEYTSTGQLIKEYHFHPQKTWMTDPLFQRTAGGDVYYYHNDHLGTPQQLVDASGNVVWEAQYSAFGKAYITVNAVENNLRFPGQYYDDETGLHQNYFRDYDAELGRYIQSDPIGLRGGNNFYIYSYSNSLRYYDAYGLKTKNESMYVPPNFKDVFCGVSDVVWNGFENEKNKLEEMLKDDLAFLKNDCERRRNDCSDYYPCDPEKRNECMSNVDSDCRDKRDVISDHYVGLILKADQGMAAYVQVIRDLCNVFSDIVDGEGGYEYY